MTSHSPRFIGAIWVSMFLAVAFNNLPVSGLWAVWHPDWVVLALIHWSLVLRHNTSLWMPFFIGLLTDAITHSLMGQHALGYVLVTYISVRLSLRMSAEEFGQQMALIFIVIGIYMLMNLWVQGITGVPSLGLAYWTQLLTSLLVWPLFQSLMSYFSMPRSVV